MNRSLDVQLHRDVYSHDPAKAWPENAYLGPAEAGHYVPGTVPGTVLVQPITGHQGDA